MSNEDFLAKCKSIDPSKEIDRIKNLEEIKKRLKNEEEQIYMIRNRRFKKSAVAAAVIAGLLSVSVVAYAAVTSAWRYFDTRVVQGEEFVTDFFVGEIDMPDGTTSVGSGINIDHEALAAAGGGAIIVEVDGEEQVVLDELHLDNLQDGLALLQLDNVLIPSYLPEGFSFNRFTFPVNPNNHQYMLGILPAAENARIYFGNEVGDIIIIQIGPMPNVTLGISDDQQGFIINENTAVLGGVPLSNDQIATIENVALFEGYSFDETLNSFGTVRNDGLSHLNILHNSVLYVISTENQNVTSYDLVRIAASMK